MFQTFLVQPIYNCFVALVGLMPYGDAGLAIVALTLGMRILLYPLFTSSIRTQMGMQQMQPELERLRERHKDSPKELLKEQLALNKKYKVRPLSLLLSMAVQIVVVIALYFALFREGFPEIQMELLYPFVSVPEAVSTGFFGVLDLLAPRHVLLAVLVGATQYLAIRLTLRRTPIPEHLPPERAVVHRMQQSMMLYFMPATIAVVSYFFAGAVGLYFLASNIISLGQEWLIKKHVL